MTRVAGTRPSRRRRVTVRHLIDQRAALVSDRPEEQFEYGLGPLLDGIESHA
jgi:hypothetical protein